jgi:hypothetical protein
MAWASKVVAVPVESPAAADWDLEFKSSHAEGLIVVAVTAVVACA